MEQACLECNEELKGRADKKFCSDYCRNNYNNRQNSQCNQQLRHINAILRKNRRVLAMQLGRRKKCTCEREVLLKLGFNPDHCTGIDTEKNGKHLFHCYEYAYRQQSPLEYELQRKS